MLRGSNLLGLHSETFFQKIRTGGILVWLKHLYKTLSSIPRATGVNRETEVDRGDVFGLSS